MSTLDINIANPESAGRVMEPGENLRAFLLEIGDVNMPKPFLLWVHEEHSDALWGDGSTCGCSTAFRVDDLSVMELKKWGQRNISQASDLHGLARAVE